MMHAVVIPYAVIHLETQVTQLITNTVRNLSFYSYTAHVNHLAHADEQSI